MNLQRATELVPADEAGGLIDGRARERRLAAVAHGRPVAPAPAGAQMNVPGEDEYRNKGVAYCPHCDGPLFKGKRVAVIGGGNSGVEAAIDLAGIVAHVTLIEFDDAAARRRGAAAQAAQPAQRRRHRRARRPPRCSATASKVTGLRLRGPRQRRDRSTSTSTASSCRSACCPTPSGSRARVELSPRGEIVDRRPRARPRCPACSPPATAPRCRSSRSSSPWATASTAALERLRPPDPPGASCRPRRPPDPRPVGGAPRRGRLLLRFRIDRLYLIPHAPDPPPAAVPEAPRRARLASAAPPRPPTSPSRRSRPASRNWSGRSARRWSTAPAPA